MGICNVHIMDGHLLGADLARGYLRPRLKVLKLVQLSLPELVLPDFLQWFPKVFSLFGLMRMVGRELRQPSLQCD